MNEKIPKATIYIYPDEMASIRNPGYRKIEAKHVSWEIVASGFETGVRVNYLRQGKRKAEEIFDNEDRPSLVILTGWGHPDVRSPFMVIDTNSRVTTYKPRHPHFSDEWRQEFDELINAYLTNHPEVLLVDFRNRDPKKVAVPQPVEGEQTSIQSNHNAPSGALQGILVDHSPSTDEPNILTPPPIINAPVVSELNKEQSPEQSIDQVVDVFFEGNLERVSSNSYERNPKARQKCIDFYGYKCVVCGFDFADFYGEIGQRFIHVHHLKPLSEIGTEYQVDPIKDLRPVCANCHAIIHKREPPYSIEDIREFIQKKLPPKTM